MDIVICLVMLAALPFLYFVFGQAFFLLLRQKISNGMCLLTGVFIYHAIFQCFALPLMLLRAPLSCLSAVWLAILGPVVVLWGFLRRKRPEYAAPLRQKRNVRLWILLLLLAAVFVQMYFVVMNPYLGWDTTFYVGTVAASVQSDSMYRYNGESGWPVTSLPMRYALSSFYLHSAVWCQALHIRAIYYAKIVQAGVLVWLANTVIFQLGCFFFSGERYAEFSERKKTECAAGMVIAAVCINFFYQSIFTTSDFLLNRALEAKGYCANLILPFLFLAGLCMWRDCSSRAAKAMLLAAVFGCVPVSMSALLTAPALLIVMAVPVLVREKSWTLLRFYLLCLIPNIIYLGVYALYSKGLIEIRV